MFKILGSLLYTGLGLLLMPFGIVALITASLLAGLIEWTFTKAEELLEKAYDLRSNK
jgi:hypothetical protein